MTIKTRIRTTDRRSRHAQNQLGFTLMELLIVMSVILILTMVAIPSLLNMTSAAHETSAMQSLRAIHQAQIQYQTTYPSRGFACSLTALGGNPADGAPTAEAAQLLQSDLSTGAKSGYFFNIVNCNKVNVNNQDMFVSYEATAVPQALGKTGHRGFCVSVSGEIMIDPAGGTNCKLTP